MVDGMGCPSEPRSQAVNIFMGNSPEDKCGVGRWHACWASVSTLESKRQGTGSVAKARRSWLTLPPLQIGDSLNLMLSSKGIAEKGQQNPEPCVPEKPGAVPMEGMGTNQLA